MTEGEKWPGSACGAPGCDSRPGLGAEYPEGADSRSRPPQSDTALCGTAAHSANPSLYNLDAERSLLGAILTNNVVYDQVAHYLSGDHFADPVHGRMYVEIGRIRGEGGTATPIALHPRLNVDEAFTDAGGLKYLVHVASAVSHVFGAADTYGPIIYDAWQRRWLLEKADALLKDVSDWSRPAEETAARLEYELAGMSGLDNHARTKRRVAEGLVQALHEPVAPHSTGIPALDDSMGGGLFPGRLYGIASRKKVGKTLLLGSIAHNLNSASIPHLFVACEMSPAEIEARCAAYALGINAIAFLKGRVSAARVADYAVTVPDHTIYEPLPGGSFSDLRRVVARALARHRIKGVLLDYWQLIGGKEPRESEEFHLRSVAQWVADMCRKHGLWALVAAQVNQTGNTRGGEGLKLAADMYYTLHRDKHEQGAWLEMEETRYTLYGDVGSKQDPGLWLEKTGPFFVDYQQRGRPMHTEEAQQSMARMLAEDL